MAVCEKLKRKKIELPEEVIRQEILTRLPIKSATRFKSVSKSWLSLFSDPLFAKEHLTRNTTPNPNDSCCLVAKKENKIVILSRYKEAAALRPPKNLNISLVGSLRGLVCLRHDEKLSLWNPAIHQSKEFTLPPSRCSRCRRHHRSIMGLSYDHANDIYKVVVFSCKLRSASVYHSNTDSWIDVSVPRNMYLLQKRGNFLNGYITIVKDCPYWTFTRYVKEPKHMGVLTTVYLTSVKFDAGSNEFKLLPEFHFVLKLHETGYTFKNKFVDLNDCLSLIVCDYGNSSGCMFDIYSLDGEEGCCVWSKMCNIGPFDFGFEFVSLGSYGGEIVFHDRGKFSCYDYRTNTIKLHGTTSTTVSYISCCFKYTPSLVFLEGMKYVYLANQTLRTRGRCSPRRLVNSLRN